MESIGEKSPSYFIQKLISEHYKQMKNPEREVINEQQEYKIH